MTGVSHGVTPPTAMFESRRPLWSEDAEQAVLAAILLDEGVIARAMELLSDGMFYDERHRRIFRAMGALAARAIVIDPVTTAEELARTGDLERAGGKDYLGFLVDVVPTAANLDYHAGLVRDHHARREVLSRLYEAARAITDDGLSAREVTQALYGALMPFTTDAHSAGFQHVKDLLWPLMEQIESRAAGARGLLTGYAAIDSETNGFRPGELVIVGAVEKTGKSAVALNIAARILETSEHAVGYVSAEMTADTLLERLLARLARIDLTRLAKGDLVDNDYPRLALASAKLAQSRLWIDDEAEPALDDVVARATKLKADHPELSLIVVDFLQLVTARQHEKSEAAQLKAIAYGLKKLAKRLKVVVLAPCQVNSKDIEEFKDRRPRLKDLQGSSGMRQAADFVALAYREGLYNEHAPDADVLELNFAACRRTRRFTARLQWIGETMTIVG